MAEPTAAQRKVWAKAGIAMPDGSYYIRNASDLSNAIKAVGRGSDTDGGHNAIRLHIMTRARALKMTNMIPDTWNSDGSLKHTDVEIFLSHFGVKGMHWGTRKASSSSATVSPDAARAAALKATVKRHGTSALSNQDLQHLVTRLNLEQQHGRLNPEHVSAGERFARELLNIGGNAGKQYAATLAVKGLATAGEAVVKKAAKK